VFKKLITVAETPLFVRQAEAISGLTTSAKLS